mmetsp:Transcript_50559/g.120215  ORF Transcript_50559/g.120215 Transcript_50559/m.120215 type:complete len:216 (-) Transcript_50559:427-1074(-)
MASVGTVRRTWSCRLGLFPLHPHAIGHSSAAADVRNPRCLRRGHLLHVSFRKDAQRQKPIPMQICRGCLGVDRKIHGPWHSFSHDLQLPTAPAGKVPHQKVCEGGIRRLQGLEETVARMEASGHSLVVLWPTLCRLLCLLYLALLLQRAAGRACVLADERSHGHLQRHHPWTIGRHRHPSICIDDVHSRDIQTDAGIAEGGCQVDPRWKPEQRHR